MSSNEEGDGTSWRTIELIIRPCVGGNKCHDNGAFTPAPSAEWPRLGHDNVIVKSVNAAVRGIIPRIPSPIAASKCSITVYRRVFHLSMAHAIAVRRLNCTGMLLAAVVEMK